MYMYPFLSIDEKYLTYDINKLRKLCQHCQFYDSWDRGAPLLGRGHIDLIKRMLYFFENLLSLDQTKLDSQKWQARKISQLFISWFLRQIFLRRGHISHVIKIHYLKKNHLKPKFIRRNRVSTRIVKSYA